MVFFKSTNEGEIWRAKNLGITDAIVCSIIIDPSNTDVIYAGTRGGGVFKSTDGGETWSKINKGLTDKYIFSLAIDTKNTNILYAGTLYNMFKFRAIYTYLITASTGVGGTISPLGVVKVNSGDSKTFNLKPDEGYRIKDVLVDEVSVGAVSTYTFTNVNSDHTIEAIFEKEVKRIVITLQIGNSVFSVNGEERYLDSPPIIKNGRTLLQIRAVVEALGGSDG